MNDLLPVFFAPEMLADSRSYSPSAAKPAAVVRRWLDLGFPVRVAAPAPVDAATLALAHDAAFVRDVLGCRRENGFGNRAADVARSLPWTTGAMLSAARAALATGGFAVAPCSGFHHARWSAPAGFCTFNGLAVTALALLRSGAARRIGILDFDYHEGDGTEDILARVPEARDIVHYTAGAHHSRPATARAFLASIPELLATLEGCDVVLYQAGADPHVDDPLGGFLTSEELYERDVAVFRGAKRLALPVAWNLAGGYQRDADGGIEPVLAIHAATMRACVEAR